LINKTIKINKIEKMFQESTTNQETLDFRRKKKVMKVKALEVKKHFSIQIRKKVL
jgi:hypothetical protein